MKRLAIILLLVIAGCKLGGGRTVSNRATAQTPPVADIETVNQDAVLAAMAKLEAEVNAIKAGRDSFAGVTLQSAAPWSLVPFMAFQTWLSHRREMRRIDQGKP